MNKKTMTPARRTARLSVMAALSVALLAAARFLPAGKLGTLCLAGFPVCMALMMSGKGWACAVYAVSALLGILLFPGTVSVAYAAFFGYYPILKSIFERVRKRLYEYLLKAALYVLLFGLYALFGRAFFAGRAAGYSLVLLFFVGAAAFAVFDWAYSLIIRVYIEKFARYIS